MKKTVLASTLAVGLGVTGFAAGNSADAAEHGGAKAEVANLAQSNPEQLNASPVQAEAYNNKLLHKLNKHNNHNKKQLQKLQLNHQAQMKLQLAHQV